MKQENFQKIHRTESGTLRFTFDGSPFEWPHEYITGTELKKLTGSDDSVEIFLSIQDPWDDEKVSDEMPINLARPEIEHFYSRKSLHYTINDQHFESERQYVKGSHLRKQGQIPLSQDLYLKVEKPWEDELIDDGEWVDLARSGTEHFISKAIDLLLIVDGREKPWHERTISFEQVVVLGKGAYADNGSTLYTVSYDRGPRQNPAGNMVKGQTVYVKNKMIFNVTATDKS